MCTLEASRSDAKMLRMFGVLCSASVPLGLPGQRVAPPLPGLPVARRTGARCPHLRDLESVLPPPAQPGKPSSRAAVAVCNRRSLRTGGAYCRTEAGVACVWSGAARAPGV